MLIINYYYKLDICIMANRNEEICNRIKSIMEEESLKQKDLAEKTGVFQSTISSILNGSRSPMPLVDAMVEKMGIKKEWLINGIGFKYDRVDNYSNNIASEDSTLSMDDKISVMKEINMLYNRHQSLLEEAQNIMKTIIELNKKILFNGIE